MKGSNPGAMSENPKQKEGIKSGHNAGEPETKGMDRILARCQRTQIKTNKSNLGAMLEIPKKKTKESNPATLPQNLKQKEMIKSGRDAGEPGTKVRD